MSAGDGDGESANYCMAVLTGIRNRGVHEVFFVIRNSLGYASGKSWDQLSRDLRPIYTASSEKMARLALEALNEEWDDRYPAMIRLCRTAWSEFVPFLDYDAEIRTVICSTNAIEPKRRATGERSRPAATSPTPRPR